MGDIEYFRPEMVVVWNVVSVEREREADDGLRYYWICW